MTGRQISLLDRSQWPTAAYGVDVLISRERIALGVIDMQYYCISPEAHLARATRIYCPSIYEVFGVR